jgi:hypothetical protein
LPPACGSTYAIPTGPTSRSACPRALTFARCKAVQGGPRIPSQLGFFPLRLCARVRWRAMRLGLLCLMLGAACEFPRPVPDPDPAPGPGETDVVLDTAADFAAGAFNDSFVQGTGNTATVEPTAWQAGKLLAELDDAAGPYDGTWGSHPPQASLVGRG